MSSRQIQISVISLSMWFSSCWALQKPAAAQLGNIERSVVTFVDGLTYEGKLAPVPELGATLEQIARGHSGSKIWMIDDGLRRIFLQKERADISSITPLRNRLEEIEIDQHGVDKSGSTDSSIGQILGIGRFDKWGRRTIRLATARGPATFTQGITLLTPRYCEVEILRDSIPNTPKKQWKMHISTKSVPIEVIRKLLLRQIDPKNFDDRLGIVQFLTQTANFREARFELAELAKDFPGLEKQLEPQYGLMLQAEADQSLGEIRAWLESGNEQLALELLDLLKDRARLSSDTLAEINSIRKQVDNEHESVELTLAAIHRLTKAIADGQEADPETQQIAIWLKNEIETTLNNYNLERLASFLRLEGDASLSNEKKLALAVSGWIVGSRAATDNLAVAISLTHAKPLIERYLSPAPEAERAGILQQLSELEAGDPLYVSLIVDTMLPPVATEIPTVNGPDPIVVTYQVPRPGGGKDIATCLVQLPPGYNPYRKYPSVVSLPGTNTSALGQIGWWAGDYHEGLQMRRGFAARNAYIVISPTWQRKGQLQYEYSAVEHARVLAALRSCLRRFSIDTDRVFLSGHFEGGDAAWDISLAHPEHWAGVIPVSADAGKYVIHYKNNARYVPFYFVYGQRDIAAREKNSDTWNRYLKGRESTSKGILYPAFDTFIIEYKGRGAEDFYEEISDIFQWMNVKRRKPDEIKSFECSTMRNSDNYFWWFELHGILPVKVIHPERWEMTKRKSDLEVSAKIVDNHITYRGDNKNATVWLSPDLVDFAEKIKIGSRFNQAIQPSTRVLLEDVRQRGDRQHPFWARVDMINNRWQLKD